MDRIEALAHIQKLPRLQLFKVVEQLEAKCREFYLESLNERRESFFYQDAANHFRGAYKTLKDKDTSRVVQAPQESPKGPCGLDVETIMKEAIMKEFNPKPLLPIISPVKRCFLDRVKDLWNEMWWG